MGKTKGIPDEQSLSRRIEFAVYSKYYLSKLYAYVIKVFPANPTFRLYNALLRFSSIVFDFIESIRTFKLVPEFGEYRKSILKSPHKFDQHPYYPSFQYFQKTHTLIGLHLGADLIRNDGQYYLVELNLGPGIRKHMRDLYDREIDPIIMNYINYAQTHKYKKIRLINSVWEPYFQEEIVKARKKYSIDIQAISHIGEKPAKNFTWIKMPEDLESETLYSFFCSRQTAIGFLLHNKLCLYSWLEEKKRKFKLEISRLQSIPGSTKFDFPDSIFQEQYWPQFVVKLADWDKGKQVKIVKAKNRAHAKEILGIKSPDDFPKIFNLNIFQKIFGRISNKNARIYQHFIPLEFDEKRHLKSFRLHAFFAPNTSLFLSAQAIHGSKPIGEDIPYGIIPLDGSFISAIYHGAFYRAASNEEKIEQIELTKELGLVINDLIAEKFVIKPQ
jgi:hypothetical protein